ncbi:MAG TPA: type III-A CRISPR-associated RAMP protein Csm5 [Ruminococcus sp.]|nr:type III-A CRISPR-associated RAMP protein Csm5 [Ruminococcus sp.]
MGNRYLYYTAELETLSPVHIGCGEKLTKLDYVFSEQSGTVYVLHPMKLFRGLQQYRLLETFEKGLPRNTSMTDFLKQNSVPEKAYASWASYSFAASRDTLKRGQQEIQKFVKDAYGMPYVPGSGLKGSLRSILATNAVLQNRSAFANTADSVADTIRQEHRKAEHERRSGKKPHFSKAMLKRESKGIEAEIFHTLERKKDKKQDMINDCMAGLIISDSRPVPVDALMLSQKIDLFGNGEENVLNTLRETLKMKTKLTFDITVDTALCPFSAEKITQAGDSVFSFYDEIFRSKFLDYLPAEIDPSHEMYLYLGGGTGFHHKTLLNALYANPEQGAECTGKLLDMQFTKAKHADFAVREGYSPKAVKTTEYQNQLEEMGLCKLRFEERNV